MQEKVEGILISKIPFKERNIIGKLLLRNGKVISVLFYGGKGGGPKQKTSLLEFGYMFKITLQNLKNKTTELYSAKDWDIIWQHKTIRENHHAFYLMCFFLEMVKKISISDNLHDEHRLFDKHLEGIFRVLSNALFFLEEAINQKSFYKNSHLFLFLLKLTQESGIFPVIDKCIICNKSFINLKAIVLSSEQGGFICENCFQDDSFSNTIIPSNKIYEVINMFFTLKYSNWKKMPDIDPSIPRIILNYLAYQFHFELRELQTYSFI